MSKQRCSVPSQAIPAFTGFYNISMNFDEMSTILMKPCLGFLRRVLVMTPTAEGKKVKIIPVMIRHLKQMYSKGGAAHTLSALL